MFRLFTICAMFALTSYCNGDDTKPAPTNPTDGNAANEFRAEPSFDEHQPFTLDKAQQKRLQEQLFKMIDEYEARIEQLENQVAQQATSQPTPLYLTPARTPARTPNKFHGPSQTQIAVASHQPSPFSTAVTWQRVKLHGEWFYIVPAKHVDSFAPPQPK